MGASAPFKLSNPMEATLRIIAQVHENKAWYEGGTSWSAKGSQEFEVKVDGDDLLYTDRDTLVNAIQVILDEKRNQITRYTYLTHEVLFHEAIQIDSQYFRDALELVSPEPVNTADPDLYPDGPDFERENRQVEHGIDPEAQYYNDHATWLERFSGD